jgi:hypothetical protein
MKITLLFLSMFSFKVWAASDGPDFFTVRNVRSDDVLNLRASHSSSSVIVTKIPPMEKGIKSLGDRWPKYDSDVPPTAENLEERSDLTTEEKKALIKGLSWCRVEYQKKQGWALCKFLGE